MQHHPFVQGPSGPNLATDMLVGGCSSPVQQRRSTPRGDSLFGSYGFFGLSHNVYV
jgi:hypothetical protein